MGIFNITKMPFEQLDINKNGILDGEELHEARMYSKSIFDGMNKHEYNADEIENLQNDIKVLEEKLKAIETELEQIDKNDLVDTELPYIIRWIPIIGSESARRCKLTDKRNNLLIEKMNLELELKDCKAYLQTLT